MHHELLERVLETVPCAIIGTDPEGRVNVFSDGAVSLLGYAVGEVLGKATLALVVEGAAGVTSERGVHSRSDRAVLIPALGRTAPPASGRGQEREWTLVRKDGARVPVMLVVSELHAPDGAFLGELAVAYDMSQRHAIETALRRSEQTLRALSESVPLAITLTDFATGRLLEANSAFYWMTGYRPEDLDELSLQDLSPGTDAQGMERLRADLGDRGSFGPVEREILRRDGSRFPALINGMRHVNAFGHDIVWTIAEDLSQRKALEAALRRSAQLDPLTGLPNRPCICDRLLHFQRRIARDAKSRLAVLYIDVDHFAEVNMGLGHEAGDLVLKEIARRLEASVREDDAVSRRTPRTASHFGSDEFLVLLEGIDSHRDAAGVAQRLMAELRRPFLIGERHYSTSVSIGIVLVENALDTPEEILRDADLAMCEAKRSGRGRSVVFDAGLRERRQRRAALHDDLRTAIDAQQLELVYQPLMNLDSGEIAGCEALVRWRHPQLGPIAPAEFIPIAEESDLIVDLGEWVLQAALNQYSQWRATLGDCAPTSISVNLSRAQLILDDLLPKVHRVLEATGVEPWRLHLEITETAVMRDASGAVRTMRALRESGIKLDLDDFGTGYSSLASLHELPIDVVKVDRSFVQGLETDRASAALIEAVMTVAQILDLSVIAEGIETPRELEQLRAMGCHLGQGYIFASPLTADEFVEFLRSGELLDRSASDSARALTAEFAPR